MSGIVAGKTTRVFHEIGKRGLSGKGILSVVAYETIGDFSMLPQKGVSCFFMVEIFDIPLHQLRLIALMFCMAESTTLSFIPVESTAG